MKRLLLVLIIILSLMICGCRGSEEKQSVNVTTDQESVTQNNPELTSNQESTDGRQSLELSGNRENREVCLVEDKDFVLDLVVLRDIETGVYEYYYRVEHKGSLNSIKSITLSDITINDDVLIGDRYISENKEEKENILTAIELNKTIGFIGIDEITSIAGAATVEYRNSEEENKLYKFSVDVPHDNSAQYKLDPYMGAMALTQMIYSDSKMDVKLIGMGATQIFGYDTSEETNNNLSIILQVENKSDETVPFSVNTCVINGICFDCGGEVSDRIPPKMSQIFIIDNLNYDIEKTGISSISSVQLLMLTDLPQEQNDVSLRIFGGRLYDIELSQRGEVQNYEEDGILTYDDNDVKVYVTGSGTANNEKTFRIEVENNTEENISFRYSDLTVNGKEINKVGDFQFKGDLSYRNGDVINNVIPPGCRFFDRIYLNGIEISPDNKYSCVLNFYTAGGGRQLFRSDPVELQFEENGTGESN